MHTKGPWKELCESQKKLLHTFRVKLDFLEQERIPQLEFHNAALLEVVRDCVNFLADLETKSDRAKALHKRAYTAHSKAKGE